MRLKDNAAGWGWSLSWLTPVLLFSLMLYFVCLCVRPPAAFAAEVEEFAGSNRYGTAATQAVMAYPSGCDIVIVASGESWADALAASGLAGALDCPILFSDVDRIPSETEETIERLNAATVLLIGSEACISAQAEAMYAGIPCVSAVERIWGANRFETQLAIYEYGRKGFDGENHWTDEVVVLASGMDFPDALSGSPLAVSKGAPIFLVDSEGLLSSEQELALLDLESKSAVILGGETCVADETLGYMRALTAAFSSDSEPNATRLAGKNRYQTSSLVAKWCVEQGYLTWDRAAFASGSVPFDALAGSILQGKRASVLLLVDNASSETIHELATHSEDISSYSFFGSSGVISNALRQYIGYSLSEGRALPMGGSTLGDGTYVWCDAQGVNDQITEIQGRWISRADAYSSLTGWLILVDTRTNETAIFERSSGSWNLAKLWDCTTGAWNSPTVKGEFQVGLRGTSFGSGYTCWYWTQFCGNYLFHSVLYNPGSKTSIQDGRLGINASHGCVRLDINNAKWIYDNIPSRTKVVVF